MVEVCEKPITADIASVYIEMFGKNTSNKTPDLTTEQPEGESSELPLLDVELGISQLSSLEDLKEMLTIMLNHSMTATIDEIDTHYQAQDWDLFKKTVHKFKSSCLYCDTTQLLKLTQKLEQLADNQDLDVIKPVYQQFQDCVISTRQYIESWLSMDKQN